MLQNSENPDRARNASHTGTASGSRAPPLRVVTSWARSATPSSNPSREDTPPNAPGAIFNVEPNGIRTAYGGGAHRTGLLKPAARCGATPRVEAAAHPPAPATPGHPFPAQAPRRAG